MSNNTQASSTTAHFGLSQWAADDLIRREDFNHDLAAIDAALWQHAQTLAAAATAAQLTTLQQNMPEVILHSQTLSSAVNSLTIDLSDKSLGQFNRLLLHIDRKTSGGNALYMRINNDATSSHYGASNGTNYSSMRMGDLHSVYTVVSFALYDGGSCVAVHETGAHGTSYRAGAANNYWNVGGFASVNSLQLFGGDYNGNASSGTIFPVGCRITLYGRRA